MSSSDNKQQPFRTFWLANWMLLRASLQNNYQSFGLVAALGTAILIPLVLSIVIPTYAYSAQVRIFNDRLQEQFNQTNRSPLTLLFRHLRGSTATPWSSLSGADQLMRNYALDYLGIPMRQFTAHLRTTPLNVLYFVDSKTTEELGNTPLGSLYGADDLMQIVAGRLPTANRAESRVEAMVSRSYANTFGVNVGDRLVISNRDRSVSITLDVVGIWVPKDPSDVRWLYAPDAFDSVILVDTAQLTDTIASLFPDSVGQGAWFFLPDIATLTPAQVADLDVKIRTLAQEMSKVPAQLERSPLAGFTDSNEQIQALIPQITYIALPITLLAALFIIQTATINARRRREEFALLHSRGYPSAYVALLGMSEWVLIVVCAAIVSIPLATGVVHLMLNTSSFLQVDWGLSTQVSIPSNAWGYFAATCGVLIVLGIPAIVTVSRNTMISVFQQRKRTPLRTILTLTLEIMMVVIVVYANMRLPQLAEQTGRSYDDPLSLVLPVLNTTVGALLANRIIVTLLRIITYIGAERLSVTGSLLLQTLSRRPERIRTTTFLLSLTVGMGGYLASFAATVDQSTQHAIAYRVGTSTQILETAPMSRTSNANDTERYMIAPLGIHLRLPGVTQVSAVSNLEGQVAIAGQNHDVRIMGVDRSQFASVVPVFQDRWYGANQSLGQLLNQLALQRNGLIVSSTIASASNIGDKISIRLSIDDSSIDTQGTIVGVVDGWPGLYPQDGGFVITNRQFLADTLGYQLPYDVWAIRDQTTVDTLWQSIHDLGIPAIQLIDAQELWRQEIKRPERQGLFSMVSLSFVVAYGLALLALVVSMYADIQRRSVEMGILMALGMTKANARLLLIAEHASILCFGIITGTILIIINTQTLLPYINGGIAPHFNTPPTEAIVAYANISFIIGSFIVLFGALLFGLLYTTSRTTIVQSLTLNQTFE